MSRPRRPCKTCPWRRSTPSRGFPGGFVDADRLVGMLEGGLEASVMQCHCTPDDRPEVCVGFALQVGHQSVALRFAVLVGRVDVEGLAADEPLHTLESLLRQHGGRVADPESASP